MHPFRAAVEAGDHDAMIATLAPDCRFNSPVAFKPFDGREVVAEVFWNVMQVFEDFKYVDELQSENSHALIFRARVGDKTVEGLDHLHVREDGLVDEFTVMMRPLSALIAMGEAMGPRVGHLPKGEVTA
jgi:hypothetical protein